MTDSPPGGPTACKRRAAVSFTGGKDSMTVLHLMRAPEVALQAASPIHGWRDEVRERLSQVAGCEVALLVTFVPAGGAQSFKAHPLEVVKQQAAALELPHLVLEIHSQPSFLESYRANITALGNQHGIDVLATGDILDVCNSFMPRAAAGTGVQLLSPLWGIPRRLLLELVWGYGMDPLITCVNTTKFQRGAAAAGQAAAAAVEEAAGRGEEGGAGAEGGESGATAASGRPAIDAAAEREAAEEGRLAAAAVTPATAGRATDPAACSAVLRAPDSTATSVSASETGGPPGGGLGVAASEQPLWGTQPGGLEGGAALLGRRLDRRLYDDVLAPAREAYGVDECGEWGEYHTMVTNSRLFAAPLELSFEAQREGDFAFLAVTAIVVASKEVA